MLTFARKRAATVTVVVPCVCVCVRSFLPTRASRPRNIGIYGSVRARAYGDIASRIQRRERACHREYDIVPVRSTSACRINYIDHDRVSSGARGRSIVRTRNIDPVRRFRSTGACQGTVIYTRENFGLMRESVTQDPSA